MSLHSDTLSWFRSNQSLLFLFNFLRALHYKQQIPVNNLWFEIWICLYTCTQKVAVCVFCRRIVKASKVDRALYNVFCIVTLSIVIYIDNICILWETNQKCSPKTLIGSVIVSVLASSAVARGFESRSGQTMFCTHSLPSSTFCWKFMI